MNQLTEPTYGPFIAGQRQPPSGASLFESVSPATCKTVARIALADVRDMGKVISDARYDAPKVARFARYWAGMADKLSGEQIPAAPGYLSYTVKQYPRRVPQGASGVHQSVGGAFQHSAL